MINLPDALSTEFVALDLPMASAEEAIAATAALLRQDPRVLDWDELFRLLRDHPPCRVADAEGTGLCILHARTEAVTGLSICVARLARPLIFPELSTPVRYIFCVAVPVAMSADYLRLVGAILRVFTEKESEAALRTAATPQAFVEALGRFELKL